MSRKPLGPGPGVYVLPTTVGYHNHDARKQRLPMYGLGTRTGQGAKSLGPGPGAYKVDNFTRYGAGGTFAYSMGKRCTIKGKTIGPGPGAHDVHLKPFFKGSNAPSWFHSWRNYYDPRQTIPGPNAYKVNVDPIKTGSPKYAMGIRGKLIDKSISPGPAAYGPGDINKLLPRSPQYLMAERNSISRKQLGPGPNYYSLMNYKPGKTSKAYSFGVRHSEYSPPMIVRCDNM